MRIAFAESVLAQVRFPTPHHERLLRSAIERFEPDPRVKAMLLTNSLGRNQGDRFSDLDFAVFVSDADVAGYKEAAGKLRFACAEVEVHMAATTLRFVPGEMDWNDLDQFEIRVGNFLAHPRLLFDRDGAWSEARARHLPYYDGALADSRGRRFAELLAWQVEHGRIAVERGLAFEAAQRIVQSLSLFFAALFVRRRVYPVDYQKRIEHQVSEWLGLPEAARQARAALAFDGNDVRSLALSLDRIAELAGRWLR
jgi:hypothetical protein